MTQSVAPTRPGVERPPAARAIDISPWSRAADSRVVMGAGFALTIIVVLVAVVLGSWPDVSGPLGPASPGVLTLLCIGAMLLGGMGALIGWRLLRLVLAQAGDAGARLHLRFVTLFAIAAVAPAVIIALFFGVLVTRGVESWFSARVQSVVENSATVARSYIAEQQDYISRHISVMARTLNQAQPSLADSPVAYGRFLRDLTAEGGFSAAYVLDHEGRVLARADAPGGNTPFLAPPPASFTAADEGDVSAAPFESSDLFRALYRLRSYPDAYLYVVLPLDPGIFQHLRRTEASLIAYREAKHRRTLIQAAFALTYLETVLLVLEGAVWLGMAAADRIAAPVARLVQAAGRVAAGDLTARVDTHRDPDEIAVLSRAFNRMTLDLREQQAALRAAHVDAETRRLFMEAVLLGVSAGVIGLDPRGRISIVNPQAVRLLGLAATPAPGVSLSEVAPELQAVADEATRVAGEAEVDVEVARGPETRLLRVRASHGAERVVLTFDDITRLVAAQRNAAWRDVARRIAHEIKNPLTPIQLSAERISRRYRREISSDTEVFDRCVETIVRQVGDIGRMVDEFSAFARMPAPRFAHHDLAELIRQAAFAQRVADPSVAVEIEEPLEACEIVCDGRIVGQALTNVLKNAGEAIAARKQPSAPGRIRVRLVRVPNAVEAQIEDNGVGLPEKNRDRLTEPYVTTREKGTGLGLAIVKRILEDHGGRLTLGDAAPGPGARISLVFPVGEIEAGRRPGVEYKVEA
ncbi:MAG TPA: PAS domain-containing sensor histidine kinase [Caulobacteraceae bacterium]|nr:PAS domain-containing sensor histidine kinase [Caulobacteraceae bacterium]